MDRASEALLGLGRAVRERLRGALGAGAEHLARPAAQGVGDIQYVLDQLVEEDLVAETRKRFAGLGALRLLSEGLSAEGEPIFEGEAGRLLVVDPVDGTRGLMHDKRSAFFLAGLAPDYPAASLRALSHAVMVELPGTRSQLSDVLLVGPGGGVGAWTEDLVSGERRPLDLRPSQTDDLRHGFGTVARFFGGAGAALGAFQDELFARLYPHDPGAPQEIFEDQYICNGGQLHALLTGRDLFVADLRALFRTPEGVPLLASHPYDLLGLPIAERAGVVVTGPRGRPLEAPLDLATPVAWIGYASEGLRQRVEPHLQAALESRGLV